ncbi:prolyl aminopeptidase [Cypionkella psychrotolerans]|uniref:prolyl aminopeptidase n=1 Tax=Cypionkella psychrotolerans TaxID=1678131 RepID=UPI0006B54858|nr:prolyl aminopeptidase [Cypionkella psychrotolerans]
MTLHPLYPPIETYATGIIDVGDGDMVRYEACGTKSATPAVVLHGGPSGSMTATQRRFFDPARYGVFLFDQRGCGGSTRHAGLTANITWHLVADIERLRNLCGGEKWVVFGGSWGSTLALAYVQSYPDRMSALILRGIYTLTKAELAWIYQHGVLQMFPDKWAAYQATIPAEEHDDMIAAYHHRLTRGDLAAQQTAALAWTRWEAGTVTLLSDPALSSELAGPALALAFARLENHYFTYDCWLKEGQMIANAHLMQGIPGVIVHGRYDMPCLAHYAYDLHRACLEANLPLIEGASHSATEPFILDALIAASDQFVGIK